MSSLPAEEVNKKKHAFFNGLSNQAEISSDLQVQDTSKPPKIAISDTYLNSIKTGRLHIRKETITSMNKGGVLLNDGSHIKADCIIFCTGYSLDLPFFEQDILNTLSYDPNDQFQPVLLHKCTFHPDLENIASVGIYRGPYFGIIELQARWATLVFSGLINKLGNEEMTQGVKEEMDIRKQRPRPQFPHGDYIGFADTLAKEIQALPDFEELKEKDQELYNKLTAYPLIPAHYRLKGHKNNSEIAMKQIDEVVKICDGFQ